MGRKYTDNAVTPLATSIGIGATTLAVGAGKGDLFPAVVGHGTPGSTPDFFVITMENAAGTREKIRVEQRAGGIDTLGSAGFPLVRGYDGTTPAAWNAGDLVDLRTEKSGMQDIDDKAQGANRAFGIRGPGTSGLNFGYYGGTVLNDGALTNIADGAVALTASQTNFVERTPAGAVSANTTAFSADKIPLYTVTTDGSGITAFTDQRAEFHFAGRLSKSVAGAADVTLSRAEAANEILELTGVLTGSINLILPTIKRDWIIFNNTTGAFNLTVKTAAGTGRIIPQGSKDIIYGDGANIVSVLVSPIVVNPGNTDQVLVDGATINWDMNLGGIATVTLAGNRAVAAPTNLRKGTYVLHVIQDATGTRTLTWNAVFKWPSATPPVLSTGVNKRDILTFISDGTNLYGPPAPLLDER